MIELFYASTPNGRKISIMLEEIKFDYKITEINLSDGEQFKTDFRKISPSHSCVDLPWRSISIFQERIGSSFSADKDGSCFFAFGVEYLGDVFGSACIGLA